MRIALVFNPFSYKIHLDDLYTVLKHIGLFPPLSLAWVAAIAEKAGHTVTIIDARILRLTREQTLEKLKEFKPDVIGFMMTTFMFGDTLKWIRHLKSNLKPRPLVLIGGYNLRCYPEASVSHPEIDFGCVEHAYYTVPALLKELEKGGNNFESIPGLAFKKNGNVIVTPHPQKIDFDLFPNPARHLLSNELYAEFLTQKRNFTAMVTSLGCPFECVFCEAGGTEFSPRKSLTVVNEMEECRRKFGINEIDIYDYEFTADRSRVLDICREIRKRELNITWVCRSRVDDVDEELLHEMKIAGCRRIYFGIESASQKMLDSLNKKTTPGQIENTITLCRKMGIKTLGFFMVGGPDDTKETVKKSVRFAVKLKLDYVQFSKCLAKPRTPLWRKLVTQTGKDYWLDWISGRETDRALPRPWTTLTNEEVDRLTKWAYIKFYSRPLFLLKHAFDCKSFREFFKKTAAYLQMVFNRD